MRHEVIPLALPVADGAAAMGKDVRQYTELAVAAVGTGFDVALKVQGKVSGGESDNTNDDWFDIVGGDITNAAKLVPIPAGVTHVRIFRTTAATPATLKCLLSGKNTRTDLA